MKSLILLICLIVSLFYSYRFGYILTGYGHGGQLVGVLFFIILLILSLAYFVSKKTKRKNNLFSFTLILFITLSGVNLTIEYIRKTSIDYFQILYSSNWANKTLIIWLVVGIITYLTINRFKFPKK